MYKQLSMFDEGKEQAKGQQKVQSYQDRAMSVVADYHKGRAKKRKAGLSQGDPLPPELGFGI